MPVPASKQESGEGRNRLVATEVPGRVASFTLLIVIGSPPAAAPSVTMRHSSSSYCHCTSENHFSGVACVLNILRCREAKLKPQF